MLDNEALAHRPTASILHYYWHLRPVSLLYDIYLHVMCVISGSACPRIELPRPGTANFQDPGRIPNSGERSLAFEFTESSLRCLSTIL
jgi:hypothetical protein